MNIKEDELEMILNQNQVEQTKSKGVLQDLKELEKQKKEERETTEKTEYFYTGLVFSGPDYEDVPLKDRPIVPVKMEVGESPEVLVSRFASVARAHNTGRKSKKDPCFTITDVINKASKKLLREGEIKLQGDGQPMYLVEVENTLNLETPNPEEEI